MHVCMYYVCMYMCMYVCMHVRMYVRTYVRVYVRVCACMYVFCVYIARAAALRTCGLWWLAEPPAPVSPATPTQLDECPSPVGSATPSPAAEQRLLSTVGGGGAHNLHWRSRSFVAPQDSMIDDRTAVRGDG